MAQLLNFNFPKLGEYIGNANKFFPTNHRTSKNSFDFRFLTTKEDSKKIKLKQTIRSFIYPIMVSWRWVFLFSWSN